MSATTMIKVMNNDAERRVAMVSYGDLKYASVYYNVDGVYNGGHTIATCGARNSINITPDRMPVLYRYLVGIDWNNV